MSILRFPTMRENSQNDLNHTFNDFVFHVFELLLEN